MFRLVERSFLKITQIVGMLFAAIMLVIIIVVSYNNIDIRAQDSADVPIVKFADYQKFTHTQEAAISQNLKDNQNFDKTYNIYIDNIVATLESLSDNVVGITDIKQKVKILSKVKLTPYPQSIQLTYLESLAKLTNQVAIVDAKVNMDELVGWHDQSFFQQLKAKDQRNFLQISSVRIEQNAYSKILEALAIFMILVIMLAVLRIEQNTRK